MRGEGKRERRDGEEEDELSREMHAEEEEEEEEEDVSCPGFSHEGAFAPLRIEIGKKKAHGR